MSSRPQKLIRRDGGRSGFDESEYTSCALFVVIVLLRIVSPHKCNT